MKGSAVKRMCAWMMLLVIPGFLAACTTSDSGTAGAAGATQQRTADRPPNVIVIIADDLGYGDVGAYGSTVIRTPNIDALAAQGVRFTSGYVTHAVCAPSRAGLMTGRYQNRFGYEFNPEARDLTGGMSTVERTMADFMRRAGYRTGMVGKWHLGQGPQHYPTARGFDEFFGVAGGGSTYILDPQPTDEFYSPPSADVSIITSEGGIRPSQAGTGLEARRSRAEAARKRFPVTHNGQEVRVEEYLTDRFSTEAVNFIDRNSARPFFLYLAYTAPHTPLQAPKKYIDRYRHIENKGQRVYSAMVSAMDDGIGQVMAALRRHGIDRNTLIVFLSDNGCADYIAGACSNRPLAGYKGLHTEGGIRVPFIMALPGTIPAGTTDDRPVSALDILPTAAALAGIERPGERPWDGINLARHFSGGQVPQRALFWRSGLTYGIRQGDWKLWFANRAPPGSKANPNDRDVPDGIPARLSPHGQHMMLYNLRTDLGERNNLAAQQPQRVAAMRRQIQQWDRGNVPPQWTSVRQFLDQHDGVVLQIYD